MKKVKIILLLLTISIIFIACSKENEEEIKKFTLLAKSELVESNILWGYTNADDISTFLIEAVYDSVSLFKDGHAIVTLKGKVGVIDIDNNVVIAFGKYSNIISYDNGYLLAALENSFTSILDYSGKVYYENDEEYIYFDRGYFMVSSEEGYKYFDLETKEMNFIKSTDDYRQNELKIDNIKADIKVEYNQVINRYYFKNNKIKKYYSVEPYINDSSVVSTLEEGKYDIDYFEKGVYYGLIDKEGNYIIDANNVFIKRLSDKFFIVVEEDLLEEDFPMVRDYENKSLYDNDGNKLTKNTYYMIKHINDSLFYVHDGKRYFFINEKEEEVFKSVNLKAAFDILVEDDVIICSLDDYYKYFTLDGKFLYEENIVFKNESLTIYKEIVNPVPNARLEIPSISIEDKDLETTINNLISENYNLDGFTEMFDIGEFEQSFSLDFIGDILVLNNNYYSYYLGAAHGNYGSMSQNINLLNAKVYSLKDLLKGENLEEEIAKVIIKNDRSNEDRYLYEDEFTSDQEMINYIKRDSYNFTVGKEYISIYYNPYEIASYAAGMPSFDIKYEEFSDLLNKESEFYKAIFK